MSDTWSIDNISNPTYRLKFLDIPDVIEDWLQPYGGLAAKDVLEFGCGEATMALAMALRKQTRRVVGAEILDVYKHCLPIANKQLGLHELPPNLELHKITPGGSLADLGTFDVIYTWSVVEHVAQYMLNDVFTSLKNALNPNGTIFLQISPLYYSAFGSHLGPWIEQPWAHLAVQDDLYKKALYNAPPTPENVRADWGVYIHESTTKEEERAALWETYSTLNKLTAPRLCRLVQDAGFQIVRELRTNDNVNPPDELIDIYHEDILKTQQIVLLLRHA
ncbi:hypothetical protein VI03_18725 [Burkholderia vietnamiensis]|uniref:Class I SAM-dependent methyltransferase n=1 Tax=Burkholderia vietnamiensis TaxID=60552 RepID=A0AAW7T0W5_BURVI|nr:class I SAM-dependent methyltransferase [Burkholderia vietnamiensis]KKI37398.1 hypothetical protein VI03_18725 [Burkholderia vietnamiensis]MBR7910452.1 class I SAM-dependent methyltransferase [Burkholderia vietnamiensis]MBR8358465.1 class I SAM-dependent methyltransferase [Burkholderia vietnamiensis]MDN7795586.1 class I SAM-dependent methyltransferase [Burkholderia vietnamiensis]HDR9278182.1 class I SAM-dependent methyltransferase [Burkholderia vietnamiensis]